MTSTTTWWGPRSRARTMIEPPLGEYFTAFDVRLVMTCRRRSGSATMLREARGNVHQDRVVRKAQGHALEDEGAQIDLAPAVAENSPVSILRDEQRVVGQAGRVARSRR